MRELSKRSSDIGSDTAYTRPAQIPGFGDRPDRFQKAVNELLQSRLIDGRKDDQGHMTIALNPHRRSDVEKELRPLWARPAVWLALLAVLVAVGAGFAV